MEITDVSLVISMVFLLGDSVCSENEYRCDRGICIDQAMVCNGHAECDLTWDDEDNCREILF